MSKAKENSFGELLLVNVCCAFICGVAFHSMIVIVLVIFLFFTYLFFAFSFVTMFMFSKLVKYM